MQALPLLATIFALVEETDGAFGTADEPVRVAASTGRAPRRRPR
ncbi:MAG: hypothetical protein ABUS79_09945 [Pseudomonadota bacterium]